MLTLKPGGARIDVFKPGNTADDAGSADLQLDDEDLDAVEVSARAQDLVDRGSITVRNNDFTLTGEVTSGDRLRFYVERETDSSMTHRWTGMARNLTYDRLGPTKGEIAVEVDDFVFGVLDTRDVTNSYTDRQLAGNSEAILDSLIADYAPELTLDTATISTNVSYSWTGTSLLEAIKELGDRANCALWGDDKTLRFEPLSNIATSWTLTAHDRGLPSVRERDDALVNNLRVNGGTGTTVDVSQTTQSAYSTVSESSREMVQVTMRKSKVAKVEVWTRTTGSAEDVIVRLQANDGGAPKDVTSQESDIARRTLSSEFVEDAGYTAFLMPEHKLPEKNVWIIVESSGSTGQEVGVDGSGNLTYKALYEYPLDTLIPAGNSIDEYRQRDGTISNTTLTTREEVQDFARETINTLDEPERELSFPAESERAHELTPGEIIAAPLPDENLNGDVIVTEVRDTYEGVRLETDITAITVDTL